MALFLCLRFAPCPTDLMKKCYRVMNDRQSGVSTAMGENILQVTGVIPGLPSALKMRNFWCFLGLFSGQLSIKLSKKALALNS